MKQNQASIWQSTHSFAGKLLRWPLRLIPHEAKIKILSGVNKGAIWEVGSGVHHCWMGTYENDKQEAMRRVLKPGMTVWDVGANVGFYTLAFSRLVGDTGKVVAFEPSGLNAAYLLQHVTLNNLTNVTVVQAAVSDEVGVVSFAVGRSSFVGAITNSSGYQIPSLSLDDYSQQHSGGVFPDVIKIDVEGAESSVLSGASRLLAEGKPELWLALHSEEQMKLCSKLLAEAGYAVFSICGEPLSEINCLEVVARKSCLA
jgi:FkbM family methyltransferase